LNLDSERFEICFEKQCVLSITTEIPDWYILEKSTGKVIIGMNQLDLWSGGHQINRGAKYLIDNNVNLNLIDGENISLLHMCIGVNYNLNEEKLKIIENKKLKIMKMILEKDKSINIVKFLLSIIAMGFDIIFII
jgi:hypothetical protein